MDWSSWGPAGHDDLTRRPARTVPDVPATPGTVVEDVASGFTGAVIGIERSGGVHVVVLEAVSYTHLTLPTIYSV